MSAIGPKRTFQYVAFHYVAFDVVFGGKADMPSSLHMSAYDPKRTSLVALHESAFVTQSGHRPLNLIGFENWRRL